MGKPCRFVGCHEPLPVLKMFAASFVGRCEDLAAGLGSQALIARIGKYL